MNEIKIKNAVLLVYLISVFFSLINTPFYFDPQQVSNQAFLSFPSFNLPLQLVSLIGIVLFFLGFSATLLVTLTSLSILFFLLYSLPEMPNHRYVMLVTTLYLFSNNLFNRKPFSIDKFVAFSRIMICIIYFFAFLAKINSDYINPTISCASIFFDNIFLTNTGTISSNQLIHLLPIYSSIIFEGLAFLLIFSNRFRPAVVLCGLLFHLGLSFDLIKYFTNFSSTMYVLLLSSLGPKFYEVLIESLESSNRNFTFFKKWFSLLTLICFALCILSGLDSIFHPENYLHALIFIRHVAWLCVSLYAISLFLFNYRIWTSQPPNPYFLNFATCLLLSLFSINCLGPYLGIKTRSGLTMYSNLRMEPNYSNHFLFKKSANILELLSSSAKVVETEKNCSTTLKQGLKYPLFELNRIHNTCPTELLTIDLNGDLLSGADLGNFFNAFTEKSSFIENKILPKIILFGPIGEGAERECVW